MQNKKINRISKVIAFIIICSWIYFLYAIFFELPNLNKYKIKYINETSSKSNTIYSEIFAFGFVFLLLIGYGLNRIIKNIKNVSLEKQEEIKQFLLKKKPSRSIPTQIIIDLFIDSEWYTAWNFSPFIDKFILISAISLFILNLLTGLFFF